MGTLKTVGDSPKRADTRPAPTAGLGDIIGAFKSIATHEYIKGVKQHGWTPFPGKLWQRNYYEHIVRSEKELTRIREYIRNNPAQFPKPANINCVFAIFRIDTHYFILFPYRSVYLATTENDK